MACNPETEGTARIAGDAPVAELKMSKASQSPGAADPRRTVSRLKCESSTRRARQPRRAADSRAHTCSTVESAPCSLATTCGSTAASWSASSVSAGRVSSPGSSSTIDLVDTTPSNIDSASGFEKGSRDRGSRVSLPGIRGTHGCSARRSGSTFVSPSFTGGREITTITNRPESVTSLVKASLKATHASDGSSSSVLSTFPVSAADCLGDNNTTAVNDLDTCPVETGPFFARTPAKQAIKQNKNVRRNITNAIL
mmetsp:Transcript_16233/g.50835  ORF Transcript_16233/g.50835 Transcript_16233/m.50835 type:complete len:254 (+) Transcript_16233:840-1601(+)